jgi:glutathionylspermidine synthase
MNEHGLAATPTFEAEQMLRIRRDAISLAGRMDPQVFDQCGIASFALKISTSTLEHVFSEAELAWRELADLERRLLASPALWKRLCLPHRLTFLMRSSNTRLQKSVRYARFDFHPTPAGWSVSEINADVPGGLLEAGPLAHIVAREVATDFAFIPQPARILATAIDASCNSRDGVIALLHATSYSDDAQVMHCLRRELEAIGRRATLASPLHLCLVDGQPRLTTTNEPVAGVFRFFPAEWLANLPRRGTWREALTHADLAVCNPLSAALLQSKRLPLLAQDMNHLLPVWSRLCPPSSALGSRVFRRELAADNEVLKPAWGRVGAGICIRGVTSDKDTRSATLAARLRPSQWLVQERFTSVPVMVGHIPQHVCLGVYVVNGRAAGIYGRVARQPIIDSRAQDVAVLLEPSGPVARTVPVSPACERVVHV